MVLATVSCGLIGCVSIPTELGGEALSDAHEVSIEELLGNGRAFDGQPVRVTGVSDLGLEFEHRSNLYASREALEMRTRQHLNVDFPDSWYEQYVEELSAFRGKYVLVEGFFGYEEPRNIELGDNLVICIPACPTNGWLFDIRRVQLLETQ